MESLERELERARDLDVSDLADAIESIGFECTRCGACCTGDRTGCSEGANDPDADTEPHTATVFPDEVRRLASTTDREWRDVARPMPFGLGSRSDGPAGETFEWALAVDDCGDCVFYEEVDAGDVPEAPATDRGDDGRDEVGSCRVHEHRPLICRTYPFSLALSGTTQPMGAAVDEAGILRVHECEGLGRDISREDAVTLARTLKRRAVRELTEAIDLLETYEPHEPEGTSVVVHDSEGPKRPDGTPIDRDDTGVE